MRKAIITTTIYVPVLLEEYIKNVKRNKHDNVFYVVIGDKKTPPEAEKYCKDLGNKHKVEIEFLGVEDQEKYLKKFPELNKHLVYNSIQRRNIGILLAYEKGAEIIVTIDDDNFVVEKDFIGKNLIVGKEVSLDCLSSNTKWVNVCQFLKEKNDFPFYHRGFPMEKRWLNEKITKKKKTGKVVVNAGFWLEDPDIDAITRLTIPIDVKSYTRDKNFMLDHGTWSPFNSQNTALAREVIPAYFLSPYIGRYDDIWASYIVQRIAHHRKEYISYGLPMVIQKRNPHNYFKDFEKERIGHLLTGKFCDWLDSIKFKKKSYEECFSEIINALPQFINKHKELTEEEVVYMKKYEEGLRVWKKTIERTEV
ncbi:MAG: hypothetical protein COU07_03230 [Candidatus Harrisonbacteria bacterium CG10_big_fil_rev_8_21_14_0_10_40_38]|uniref:Glycosyltransferase 2-like domain-containing protein n=1 Tax=Candidatus Harrisonbacteria bacterium CG10_big_fil_rev_8_21_14_0_10_40_38 TaxID=1974583 RepID=A0A2H0URQ3_9BACT|nr:MAG: hypothetical protein COU07_03230 [Candidatus Harrisonbacteria bacterium CG10_big_fil_rev_8_21_14_0_10_40_38]